MVIIFRNAVNKAFINERHAEHCVIPCNGDHILLTSDEYIVCGRLFNRDLDQITIFVKKATHNDVTYM